MNKYLKQIFLRLIALNFIFLLVMSVYRLIFFLFYGKGIDFTGAGADILKAFYMGVRFDLAVIAYLNMPVTLALAVFVCIGNGEYMKKMLSAVKYYYAAVIGSLFVLLCVDFGFYSYFQNHFNILVYGLFEDDTKALISTLHENYPLALIFFGFVALYAIVFMLSKYMLRIKEERKSLPKSVIFKVVAAAVMLSLNFIAARGSFGIFPLGVDNAEVSSNTFLNKVAINGIYTLQAAIEARNKENNGFDYIEKAGYKDNIRQAFADFLGKDIEDIPQTNPEQSLVVKLPFNKNIEDVKPNVIFIVMESFGSDLIKYNSDTFNVLGELKKHFDEDYVFLNFLPGHQGTIGSLEAGITNVVRRPLSRYLSQSKYAYKKYKFAGPLPYKSKGYETIFMYGGNAGWRNVGSFMPDIGFDKVLGEGSMNKEYPRNQWGVYDEYLFDFIFRTLESDGNKKFIYVMTTSNHPPYSLPDDYKKLPLYVPAELEKKITGKELAPKRFAVYQYANEMLGRFITRIKNSKYAENTIIAVTGDHNFWSVFTYPGDRLFDSLAVPFYLYIPQKLKPAAADTKVFGSHTDILPTLYNLSLSDTEYMAMGTDLFSKQAENNFAYNDSGALMDENCVVNYNFAAKEALCYTWNAEKYRSIVPSKEEDMHKKMIKRHTAAVAISDYLIKYTGY